MKTDVAKWGYVKEMVLVCIPCMVCLWREADCGCVRKTAVVAMEEECAWLVLGEKVEW